MMPILPDALSPNALNHLITLQNQVDNEPDMEAKYKRAVNLWQTRKNRILDRENWDEIEQKLVNGGPRPGLCHYCEFDRTTATEHIFPKKHFPERGFQYENYLLACHRCNSIYKGDKFAVFSPAGSNTRVDLPNSKKVYTLPPSVDAVLINQRIDNPQDYLELDLFTGSFLPQRNCDDRGKVKADYTITLLRLNADASLLRYRKKALNNYQQQLSRYVKVKNASDFTALLNALPEHEQMIVVQSHAFETEQRRLLKKFKAEILNDPFPFAWREIIAKKHLFPHIYDMLEAAPEAEMW
jgi:uncharacterized protein (TIGR02646 family)